MLFKLRPSIVTAILVTSIYSQEALAYDAGKSSLVLCPEFDQPGILC